jgi:hypothetical protein
MHTLSDPTPPDKPSPKIVRPADVGLTPWFVQQLDPAPTVHRDLTGHACYLLDDLADKVGEGAS